MNRRLRHGWLLATIFGALCVGTLGIVVGSSSTDAVDARHAASSCSAASREEMAVSKVPDSDQLARRWYRRYWRRRYI
jgi:hypothetical protein